MTNKLPYVTDSLESVPEELQTHYTEEDGSFILNVAGVVTKQRHDEFRESNKKLQERLNALEFVDIDEYKNLKLASEKDSAKGLVQEHDVDNIVNSRVGEMRQEHDKEVDSLVKQLSNASSKLSTLLIDNAITNSATKHKVKEGAIDDILARGRSVFKVEDNDVVAYNNAGEKVYNKSGDPLSIDDFMTGLEKSANHLFQESTGGKTIGNKPSLAPKRQQLSGVDLISQGLQQKR